jgi:hypothetical protein
MPTIEEKTSLRWRAGRRALLIARMTLAEARHGRVVALTGVVGAGLVLLGFALRGFNFGSTELRFLVDFGFGAIGLTAVGFAALATAQLHFDDLTRGSAAIVLTRALRRGEYLAGRLAGVLALLGGFIGVLLVLLGLMVSWRARQLSAPMPWAASFAQAALVLWLKASLVSAMTLLICTYARSALFATAMGLLMSIVAHLRPFGPDTGWFRALRLWPDLTRFDVERVLAGGGFSLAQWSALMGYWAAFLAAFWLISVYVFRRQEF